MQDIRLTLARRWKIYTTWRTMEKQSQFKERGEMIRCKNDCCYQRNCCFMVASKITRDYWFFDWHKCSKHKYYSILNFVECEKTPIQRHFLRIFHWELLRCLRAVASSLLHLFLSPHPLVVTATSPSPYSHPLGRIIRRIRHSCLVRPSLIHPLRFI